MEASSMPISKVTLNINKYIYVFSLFFLLLKAYKHLKKTFFFDNFKCKREAGEVISFRIALLIILFI